MNQIATPLVPNGLNMINVRSRPVIIKNGVAGLPKGTEIGRISADGKHHAVYTCK